MKLGEKILKLRKDCRLSQEQLAERVNVTRQTISNWELGETSPNPEQLKILSKELNVSIDELLDNDIKNVLEKKVTNTEQLAGIIIKILKAIGVAFIVFLLLDVIALVLFNIGKFDKNSVVNENYTTELNCSIDGKTYNYSVESDTDDNIVDASGSDYIIDVVKDKNFNKAKMLVKYIESYFKDNGGSC